MVKMTYIKLFDEIQDKDDPILNSMHEKALKDNFYWDTEKEGTLETVTFNEMFKHRIDYGDGVSIVYTNGKDIENDFYDLFLSTHVIVLKQV